MNIQINLKRKRYFAWTIGQQICWGCPLVGPLIPTNHRIRTSDIKHAY